MNTSEYDRTLDFDLDFDLDSQLDEIIGFQMLDEFVADFSNEHSNGLESVFDDDIYNADVTDDDDFSELYPILFPHTLIREHISDFHVMFKFHPKRINPFKNIECPITYKPIRYNRHYLTCAECKYNFGKKAMFQHFKLNGFTCPMCRDAWRDMRIYINISPFASTINYRLPSLKHYLYLTPTRHNKRWFFV
ncbi:MAG: hypothetical protein ACOVRN_00480 [Flavobacterium sp.]